MSDHFDTDRIERVLEALSTDLTAAREQIARLDARLEHAAATATVVDAIRSQVHAQATDAARLQESLGRLWWGVGIALGGSGGATLLNLFGGN